MIKLNTLFATSIVALALVSCKENEAEPTIVVPPSSGSTLTLNGIIANEDGASAGNSVYVDLSADKQTPVARDSWDLGFYCGNDFKVILNATNGVSVISVNKTDINAVTSTDFDPNNLKVGHGQGNFTIVDDGREKNILNKTAIAPISQNDAENKVYIVNRKGGSANVLPNEDLYKIKILRKGTTGYSLQYAKVNDKSFKILDISKNNEFNFQFVSLAKEAITNVEPQKTEWDIIWGYSIYFTATIPYGFSDLVFINNIGGVTAAEILTETKLYKDFSKADASSLTFSANRDIIGSNWRATTGNPAGVKSDRFYVIKDSKGNIYKLKFNSFGVGNDTGTRGKPVIQYELLK